MGIINDIERPSSPVAQILRSAVPLADAPADTPAAVAPAARPPGPTDTADTESELRDLMREGCAVLAQLPEGMAADIIDGLEHAPESPVCAVIRRATPIAPAPEPASETADDGAEAEGGDGIRPYVEAEAVPGAGRARQLPSVVGAEPFDAAGARREEAARRPSDAYEVEREQELQTMALRLETAYEQLEEQKRAHDAAIQQVLCGWARRGWATLRLGRNGGGGV